MIKDTHKLQGFDKFKLPKLHGHVKIKTYYPLSGNIAQIVEGDNIITNAVRDIFANNYMGCIGNGSVLPLWSKWYGGVLCYQSAHPTNNGQLDPDVYFPQTDAQNPLIAHAGGTAIDPDHDDDSTRGNPVKTDYVATINSIKQVWEWGTSHGNGVISALSLTHADTGSYGLGNAGYAFRNSYRAFEAIQSDALTSVTSSSVLDTNNLVAQYDDNHGIGFHIGDETEFIDGNTIFQTDELTIYIRKLPYTKAGLFDTLSAQKSITISEETFNLQKQFTVTLPFNLYCQPSYEFDYENKYLWIFSNINGIVDGVTSNYSNTTVKYAVIDCNEYDSEPESRIVTNGTITSDTANLGLTSLAKSRSSGSTQQGTFARIVKDGNYVYLPTSSGVSWGDWAYRIKPNYNGFKKINIASQSDQTQISFNDTLNVYNSPIKFGNFVVLNDRVCNGNTGYTCQRTLPTAQGSYSEDEYVTDYNWHFQEKDAVSSLVFPVVYSSDTLTKSRYILANKMVNTTKYNLPSAIQKSASQAMSVEYTLTEVSDEEEE